MKRKTLWTIFSYAVIAVLGIALLFPILYMFMASFKTNAEIFGSTKILPETFTLDYYIRGWQGNSQFSYWRFFANTFILVIPTVFFTLISCTVVAYGFARFKFRFKKLLFAVLLATMMLPNTVIIIPRYLLFNKFHWIDSYLPFYIPALLGCYPFFTYQLVQFMRGIPRELDEAAYIDGCGTFRTLVSIMAPLLKPALFSAGLLQFIWTYNDYFNTLIYVNSTSKFPVSLAMRMTLDAESVVEWGKVMAMACLVVLPLIVLFFSAQKYFVEGITAGGVKG
jgi:oligogalacturonide transport system permease protein